MDFIDEGTAHAQEPPIREGAGFYDVTGAMLLCGRSIDPKGRADELLSFYDRAMSLLEHEAYRVVPANDLSRWSEWAGSDEGRWPTFVVGLKVATGRADPGISPAFSIEQVRARLSAAQRLLDDAFWAKLLDHPAVQQEPEEIQAWLVPFGPLASASLAFGRLAPSDDEAPEGLEGVQGQDMNQEPFGEQVIGVCVESTGDGLVAPSTSRTTPTPNA